jgi:ATP-dependent Clp protease, protease subunit
MSLRQLYAPKAFERPSNYQADPPSNALARWADMPRSDLPKAGDAGTEISIYDQIGDDGWGGGTTARMIAAILRNVGEKPVCISINSPGGDMFEGIAIYNLLREHKAEVTVKVRGIAASAASVIAMAGDTIIMGRGSFMMIHNAWGMVIGNRHDFTGAASQFEEFDQGMAGIYEKRTGMDRDAVAKLMDAESFLSAESAIAKGFADQLSDDEEGVLEDPKNPDDKLAAAKIARNRIDSHLAQSGVPRSERRRLISASSGMSCAADPVTPSADTFDAKGLLALAASFRQFNPTRT